MKRVKFALAMMIIVVGMLIACGKNSQYDAKYDYVLEYLHDTYGGSYTIDKVSFEQHDYGITGGQFIYSFEIRDKYGKKYNAFYMKLTDISEDTVKYLSFESK
ncbi:MAG: hypothetical protein MJ126_04190 [Lachnospiraceae bacterium]|nr:hypothetical protein [Lachnospiraceae bacterium]